MLFLSLLLSILPFKKYQGKELQEISPQQERKLKCYLSSMFPRSRRIPTQSCESIDCLRCLALSSFRLAVSSVFHRTPVFGLNLRTVLFGLPSYTSLHHYDDCVDYPYQCTLRLWYLETPMTPCNGRVRRH